MKNVVSKAICPCRTLDSTPVDYAQCCQPWHLGLAAGVHAPTAEQLMRSRYSAYALATANNPQGHAMLDYLHATWHVSSAPGDLELSPMQWMGLEVLQAQQSGEAGVVEFLARYKVNGKAHKLHEVSRFTSSPLINGVEGAVRWWYIDGQVSDGQVSEG
jgi:SEC-C motif domain protein